MNTKTKTEPLNFRTQFCLTERQLVINVLMTVVDLLNEVLSDNVEVVLHDMTRPENSVIAITHGHVTGRGVGDSILAGPKGDAGFAAARDVADAIGEQNSIIASYNTVTKNGVTLHSSTAIFRDSDGMPFAALCFNSDMTIPHMAHAWLSRMLGKDIKQPAPSDHQPAKVGNLMDDIVAGSLTTLGKPINLLTREEKIAAVEHMQSNGMFVVRGGVNRAAKALGVTRYTIYNYLDELKKRNVPE